MHDIMVRMWGRLIIAGRKKIEDVPEALREDVVAWVNANY